MIYDRPYMREPGGSRQGSALHWIIGTLIATFVAQQIALSFDGSREFVAHYLYLTRHFTDGYLWTLFTYGLFHDGALHILLNLLGFYLLGRALEPIMGTQRFVGFVFGSTALGGLAWLVAATFYVGSPHLLGVSAVCCGMLAVFGTLYAEQRIGFLLIPWTLKAKYAAIGFAVISLVLMATSELSGNIGSSGVAHSAHLGGMLAGWLYARFVHHRTGTFSFSPAMELPAWLRRRKRAKARVVPTFTVNVTPPPQDLRAEVDRILDKINSEGFGSLTEDERRILDDARDLLNKR